MADSESVTHEDTPALQLHDTSTTSEELNSSLSDFACEFYFCSIFVNGFKLKCKYF